LAWTAKFVGSPKLPVPVPRKTETVFAFLFVTARSILASPLKSPVATAAGPSPVEKFLAGVNDTGCADTRITETITHAHASAATLISCQDRVATSAAASRSAGLSGPRWRP